MYKAVITTNDSQQYTNDRAINLSEINQWIQEISQWLQSQGKQFSVNGPINLLNDQNYINEQIRVKRESEYPAISEVVEALIEYFIEDRPAKLEEIQNKRQAVKNKYPKPGGN